MGALLAAGLMPHNASAQDIATQTKVQSRDCAFASGVLTEQSGYVMRMTNVPMPAAGPTFSASAAETVDEVSSKLDAIRSTQSADHVSPRNIAAAFADNASADLLAEINFAQMPVDTEWSAAPSQKEFACPQETDEGRTDKPQIDATGIITDSILGSIAIAIENTPLDAAWAKVNRPGSSRGLRRIVAATGAFRVTDEHARIAIVNSWVNARIAYVEDISLYHKVDYWASARETLLRKAGDCEDFAIAKMELLMAMGVSRNQLRLVVARDLVRNADHALLLVDLPSGPVVLDNATDTLLDARVANDYRPIMSFTFTQKFIHGYTAAAAPRTPPMAIALFSATNAPTAIANRPISTRR